MTLIIFEILSIYRSISSSLFITSFLRVAKGTIFISRFKLFFFLVFLFLLFFFFFWVAINTLDVYLSNPGSESEKREAGHS